jgi:GNAT superfamily N-acetyltransferase
MSVTLRPYNRAADFDAVGRFLIRHTRPHNRDGNFLQPAWEYMHFHPSLDESALDHCAIWEDDGEIVAVAHTEWRLGETFFQLHPDYGHLKPAMLDHAQAHLTRTLEDGRRELVVYLNDFDTAFEPIALERGYTMKPNDTRPMSEMPIPYPFPAITLPEGYRLLSLADEFNLEKMHRVLWRGFNHEGEPPPEGIVWREIMTSGPHFRRDLTIVVEAPSGHWVSFCGLWYEPVNRYCYVEPMATDPDYRRMGVGKGAMMEGIRRCAAEGATVAYVGSDQPYYLASGFTKLFDARAWIKTFPA